MSYTIIPYIKNKKNKFINNEETDLIYHDDPS